MKSFIKIPRKKKKQQQLSDDFFDFRTFIMKIFQSGISIIRVYVIKGTFF